MISGYPNRVHGQSYPCSTLLSVGYLSLLSGSFYYRSLTPLPPLRHDGDGDRPGAWGAGSTLAPGTNPWGVPIPLVAENRTADPPQLGRIRYHSGSAFGDNTSGGFTPEATSLDKKDRACTPHHRIGHFKYARAWKSRGCRNVSSPLRRGAEMESRRALRPPGTLAGVH